MINKLASSIYNNIVGGLSGITATPNISIQQLEDDVVDEWLLIIKEYAAKNLIPRKDLLLSINCIELDCLSLDKCPSCTTGNPSSQPELHFEIPQIVNDSIDDTIEFIGSADKIDQYKVYTDTSWQFHKYLRRGSEKPFVYIQPTPNENNMYDGWLFNATPFVKKISIIAIFKDIRQISLFDCCNSEEIENRTFIAAEIKKRLSEKYIRYYRQLYQGALPNDQVPR